MLGRMTRSHYITVFFVLLTGCAHDYRATQNANLATITVCVRGSVNNPGRQTLASPFTIEHAIEQARGYNESDAYVDRFVDVLHKNGGKIRVRQVDFGVFILADDDYVDIWRE